jgi:hypothetical protein
MNRMNTDTHTQEDTANPPPGQPETMEQLGHIHGAHCSHEDTVTDVQMLAYHLQQWLRVVDASDRFRADLKCLPPRTGKALIEREARLDETRKKLTEADVRTRGIVDELRGTLDTQAPDVGVHQLSMAYTALLRHIERESAADVRRRKLTTKLRLLCNRIMGGV